MSLFSQNAYCLNKSPLKKGFLFENMVQYMFGSYQMTLLQTNYSSTFTTVTVVKTTTF